MLQAILIGNLGADAEVKNANGREFTTIRVAHTERWTDENGQKTESTTWVDCNFQGRPNVLPYLKKGTQVFVSGHMSLRIYSSKKDRCMKAGVTINVKNIELLGGKAEDIPSILYKESDNSEVKVQKWYNAAAMVREVSAPEYLFLLSRNGGRYKADRNGWLFPVEDESVNDDAAAK